MPQTVTASVEAAPPAHVTRGLRRVLEAPAVYRFLQRRLGTDCGRRCFVRDFIRPFAGARLLDVGCGPAAILGALPPEVDYVGCDLNPAYIRSARETYGARGQFFCADLTGADSLAGNAGGFDIILASALLHHLDDDAASRLCAGAHALLKPGGRLITLDGVYVPGQPWLARYLLAKDRGQAVRTPEGYLRLLGSWSGEVQATVRSDLMIVPYTHFIMVATKP